MAAIITEPMLGNFGCADPLPGFMDGVRRLCDEYGIVWILDEVKTGFRIAKGGAQEKYGYQPDITTYAKALGNGYPVAAYGGKAKIMDIVGQGVTQGGTYAGNAVAAAAAKARWNYEYAECPRYIDAMGSRLQNGLRAIFKKLEFRAFSVLCLQFSQLALDLRAIWMPGSGQRQMVPCIRRLQRELLRREFSSTRTRENHSVCLIPIQKKTSMIRWKFLMRL